MYFTSRAHLLSFNVEIKIKKFRKGMYVISWITPPPLSEWSTVIFSLPLPTPSNLKWSVDAPVAIGKWDVHKQRSFQVNPVQRLVEYS